MKKWLIWVLVLSICLNLYLFGKDFWFEMYTPNEKDKVILGEMVQHVVKSEDYKKLDVAERIYAITPGVDRNKGGVYPFHYDVKVSTDKQSYIFTCMDKTCTKIKMDGLTSSRYTNNEPVLPLKE